MSLRYKTINKEVGETPLIAIERFRKEANIDPRIPLAYAGRLDPMAKGKLLVLIGEECKHQKKYHGLDKEYVVDVVLGIESDSGDVLGIVKAHEHAPLPTRAELSRVLRALVGNITLPYPVFSSKTVNGKPLFLWQLENRIGEIEIPTKTSRIYSIELLETQKLTGAELAKAAIAKIETIPPVLEESKRLGADFRRDEVRSSWQAFCEVNGTRDLCIIRLRIVASSGTYMRSLAEHIGKELGTTALALSISRTMIGRYQPLFGRLGFWRRRY